MLRTYRFKPACLSMLFLFTLLALPGWLLANTAPAVMIHSATAGLLGTQEVRPLKQPDDQQVVSDPGEMVLVAGGTLSDIGNGELDVDDFFIGKYPVTKGEWDRVRNWAVNNGYDMNAGLGATTNHPVTFVTWFDVVKWCNAKSQMEGLAPAYKVGNAIFRSSNNRNATADPAANGYRLPTDAEWEYAARGGRYSQGYTYSGGNDINAVAWYSGNSSGQSQPVGMKMPNELGLYDMSGNVWEWIYTEFGRRRVQRGGGWFFNASICRVSFRYEGHRESNRDGITGFRLARSAGD